MTRMIASRWALVTLLLVNVMADTTDYVSSKLMIHIPHSLYRENGYDHRVALFGIPPNPGSITHNVYYADSELCDAFGDTSTDGYPARETQNGEMKPWEPPFILMINRGSCSFVQKVRNAQHSGAAGVIIADNTCLCTDSECNENSNVPDCEPTAPVMADDGSGSDISIPSFLMLKQDADKVKDELLQNHQVQVEMSWNLPNPSGKVEYDMFTVPNDVASQDFLLTFKTFAVALGDRAFFTPHMFIYDGIRINCHGEDGENLCYNLCTNHGRYCAVDPDNDLEQGISGQDVVRESLRRICIWHMYGEDGIGEVWWDYIADFTNMCSDPDLFANEDCVNAVYSRANIDADAITNCMRDGGGLDADTSNTKLDHEIKSQSEHGVVSIPTAFVNTIALHGNLTASNMFAAICSAYQEGAVPAICQKCRSCQGNTVGCVSNGYCSTLSPQESLSSQKKDEPALRSAKSSKISARSSKRSVNR